MSWLPGRCKSIQSLYTYTIPRYNTREHVNISQRSLSRPKKTGYVGIEWFRHYWFFFFVFRYYILILLLLLLGPEWVGGRHFWTLSRADMIKKNSNFVMHDIILLLLLLLYHHRYPSIYQMPENRSSRGIWIYYYYYYNGRHDHPIETNLFTLLHYSYNKRVRYACRYLPNTVSYAIRLNGTIQIRIDYVHWDCRFPLDVCLRKI